MKVFLKKYWLIFLLSGIVILLLITKLLLKNQLVSNLTAETIPSPRIVPLSVTNRSIVYQFNLMSPTNFPASLPVYKISSLKTNSFPETEADLAGEKSVNSDASAVDIAKTFLTKSGVGENFFQQNQVEYLRVVKMSVYPATGSANIDVYAVNFWPELDGLTIVPAQPNAPLNSVWIGKNGKVQKAFSTTFSLTKNKEFPLRPLSVAQQDVTQQKGTLVWLDTKKVAEGYSQITVQGVFLEKVYLACFLPANESDPLEPVYVFEGKAVLQGEEKTVGAVVYLPAIEEKYLIPVP